MNRLDTDHSHHSPRRTVTPTTPTVTAS
jgi:hypothetical protein